MAVVYGGNKFFVKCYEKGTYAGCPAAFIIAPGNAIARLCYTIHRMVLSKMGDDENVLCDG